MHLRIIDLYLLTWTHACSYDDVSNHYFLCWLVSKINKEPIWKRKWKWNIRKEKVIITFTLLKTHYQWGWEREIRAGVSWVRYQPQKHAPSRNGIQGKLVLTQLASKTCNPCKILYKLHSACPLLKRCWPALRLESNVMLK